MYTSDALCWPAQRRRCHCLFAFAASAAASIGEVENFSSCAISSSMAATASCAHNAGSLRCG